MCKTALGAIGAALLLGLASPAAAEEGMWPFDEAPVAQVREALGVSLDARWLDHLRGASVRLTSGCSASIVSHEGLVLTNQHCVVACAQHLSRSSQDYVADGFLADPGMNAVGAQRIGEPPVIADAGTAGQNE